MRRIRYEFKAKGIKKKKVTIEISIDGVKVTLRKKRKRKYGSDDDKSTLFSHPIYRIFYVSHDSQDMKIFSYIARDGASNVFKCAVFKANKKNQAMRVVRTVGQAFEVCHKLSITAPDNENVDHEEHETLTQDLPSDVVSDITSDKGRKEFQCDLEMEGMSLPSCDDNYFRDSHENKSSGVTMPRQFDLLPPPTSNKKHSPLTSAETYASPQSDILTTDCSGAPSSLPLPGSALSTHHEIQLLREQFEQQIQQTQATMAQLQLAREQLASEQAARIEAQTRTHQLLVHNRELLDHIAALVSHLQNGSEKSGAVGSHQQNSTHLTLPQHQPTGLSEHYMPDLTDPTMDSRGFNPQSLIENIGAASRLPSSPLKTYNPTGSMFHFPYSPDPTFENQLLHRLQAMSGYPPQSPYPYSYNPVMPYFQSPFFPPSNVLSSNLNLSQSHQQFPPSPVTSRHSFSENQIHGARHSSEPRQIPYQYSNTIPHSSRALPSMHLQNYSQNLQNDVIEKQKNLHSQLNQQSYSQINKRNSHSQLNSHNPNSAAENNRNPSHHGITPKTSSLIKPLSQVGTLTTTDSDGKVRVIVPVPSNASNSINNNKIEAEGLLANLKLTDNFRMNGPPIQRSTSEKVPNRSELMSQLSSTAKVERWFELLEPMSISRPESGFVSYQDPEQENDDDERAILEGTRSLLMKLSARKQRKLLSLKLGKVTTF